MISLLSIRMVKRPSWGMRDTAISMLASILIRETMGRNMALGGGRDLPQPAVNTETDLYVVFFWTDVDIAGAFPNGLGKNGVGQADHGCAFCHVHEGTHLNVFRGGPAFGLVVLIHLHLLHFLQCTADAGKGPVKAAG